MKWEEALDDDAKLPEKDRDWGWGVLLERHDMEGQRKEEGRNFSFPDEIA